ncbi:mitochondrial carrier domain-containing protein [Leucosporidium creatinivorum]|uniref:Mitochondrial carrier domain-containing protein n=1 Tax=Leucosporidium creatinivorum TaxID=106004 RepID=A0A1Y2D625_9BASI|nr:mitochondrial carrier domain-containing protein [Leucosporidium creatinivorum]
MRITLTDRDPSGTTVWFHGAESMLAGAGAGLVTSIVTCPLDVIKTRLQAGGLHGGASGLIGTFSSIWTHEGFRGFYRGLGPTIIGYLPTWAIYFTVYDKVKVKMGALRGDDDPLAHIVAAMSAGASSTICTNPLWVVKTRFMTQQVGPGEIRYRHTLDAIQRMYQSEGVPTFYRGLVPALIGVSHIAVQFPLYEQFKVYYRPPDGSDIPSSTILFCSSTSKMIASVATYPHEVLRTRLQIQKASGDGRYAGIVETFKQILRTEGYHGLYRGMGVNLLRTVPASALTILTYEVLMRRLYALSHPQGRPK